MQYADYKIAASNIDLSDYSGLLNLGRKFKKIECNDASKIKIGVVGSSSIQLVVSVLRVLLCRYGIYPEIYEGEYNGISLDVFDDDSALYKFNPSFIVVLPDYHDVYYQKPNVLATEEEVTRQVSDVVSYYINICEKIHEKLPRCQILLSNFVEPIEEPLGNLGGNYLFSTGIFYKLINIEFIKQRKQYVLILDMNKTADYIGKKNWFDESAYFLSKSGFALENIGYCCDTIARQFEALLGKPRKCLVMDLDNTLWGGVVGDLGYDGIMLDPNDAEGEAYINFQKYVLLLKERGVILAVCSKNDFENAKEPFDKNENMILKYEDISAFVANWSDKVTNIREISKELNIGTDSLVFFDDNPTEREIVKEFLPEVKVVDVPKDPALYVRALNQEFCFEWTELTKEDIGRVQSYTDNRERTELLATCDNYDEFLKKLEMKVLWKKVSDQTISRFAQLTNKSNQFNLRTQRYTEAEINDMSRNDEYELFTVSMNDKFSNYGIIACVILHYDGDSCFIDNWVMSCRVLKKTVENFTIDKIVKRAREKGTKIIRGEYIPSKKNSMVKSLLSDLGFSVERQDDERTDYILREDLISIYSQTYYLEEIN